MNKNFIATLLIIFVLLNGCQTIKKKSDEVVEKENEKFGMFLGPRCVKIDSTITK